MRPLDFQDFITNKGYVATPNFTKMRKALHKAAKRGRASAQCTLAILYLASLRRASQPDGGRLLV